MDRWICTARGAQFAERSKPPVVCPICDDDRQPPNRNAVPWTTLERLTAESRRVTVEEHEPGLVGIGTDPGFAIGQRPLLVGTPAGNVLWDCMAYLDDAVEQAVRAQGPLIAIAISRPHFYTTMVKWADRFDVPTHLHASDHAWVMRPSPRIRFWDGDRLEVAPGATLIRLDGHFPDPPSCTGVAPPMGRASC